MREKLKALLTAIFGRLAEKDEYWPVDYVPTDLEKIDRQLGITKLATENGKAGLPRPEATEYDYGHKAILTYFGQVLSALHIRATTRLAQYGSSSGVSDLEQTRQTISQACHQFQRAVEQRIGRFKDELKGQRAAISTAERELTQFKNAHRLDKEPSGPTSLFLYLALPVFLLAVDVSFNAAVFKDASPEGQGLKSGIWTAFLLAFFNVVLATALGYWFRYKNSAGFFARLFGWLCGAALVLYIPLNGFVAHFRDRVLEARRQMDVLSFDQIITQRQHLLQDAADNLVNLPFGLSSLESYALAVIGLLCAYVAAADGYRLDDAVPGYTKVRGRLASLEAGLSELKEEFRSAVSEIYSTSTERMTMLSTRTKETLHRIHSFFGLRERLIAVYDRQSRDYADSCAALITKYRDLNLAHRGGIPPPKYFDEPAPKPRIPAVEYDTLADGRDISYYEQAVIDLQQRASEAIKCIHERWVALEADIRSAVDQ